MYHFRTEEEIKNDMLQNVKNTVDKSENSIVHDAISPAAIEFQNSNIELNYVAGKIDLENLEAVELERFINQRTGIKRKASTRATTILSVSGEEGTVINTNDIFSTDNEVDFSPTENYVINETGLIKINVECLDDGSVGNVPSNSIIKVNISGVVDVYNENKVVNGYDGEYDESLISRYYEKLQRPAKSGNKYHYEQWAKEVEGVGEAKTIPRWSGPLTVKVIIVDANKKTADTGLVDKVFEHIEENRPFGADVTVVSATPKTVDISVTLTLLDGFVDSSVKENIKINIENYLKTIAFRSIYVSYAKIGSIILDTEGVLDYSDLTLNLGIANIEVLEDEVALVGGVT